MSELTDEQLRIRVAELCGWIEIHKIGTGELMGNRVVDGRRTFTYGVVPNYPKDLNAIHEAEILLTKSQKYDFNLNLARICTGYGVSEFITSAISATARQRCLAFIKTMEGEGK